MTHPEKHIQSLTETEKDERPRSGARSVVDTDRTPDTTDLAYSQEKKKAPLSPQIILAAIEKREAALPPVDDANSDEYANRMITKQRMYEAALEGKLDKSIAPYIDDVYKESILKTTRTISQNDTRLQKLAGEENQERHATTDEGATLRKSEYSAQIDELNERLTHLQKQHAMKRRSDSRKKALARDILDLETDMSALKQLERLPLESLKSRAEKKLQEITESILRLQQEQRTLKDDLTRYQEEAGTYKSAITRIQEYVHIQEEIAAAQQVEEEQLANNLKIAQAKKRINSAGKRTSKTQTLLVPPVPDPSEQVQQSSIERAMDEASAKHDSPPSHYPDAPGATALDASNEDYPKEDSGLKRLMKRLRHPFKR